MKKKWLLYCFLVVALLAQAQENTPNDVKVGLVLSGGGAKGLAHIGVLKAIDSAGVRLDYISGSSMGAIVGGLYASGYSGKQLDSLFTTVNFNDLIQDRLPRKAKTFYEKEDAEKYALSLLVAEGKIGLPKAISNGQNFYNFFSKVTTHVKDVQDFSKLPIPFFCTGTDIETGEALVFDKGFLPDVVAASGALPTVYSPIKYKGRLITDGGVTNNYPVEEIRKRGVELVIGVDVQDTLMNRKQLKSVTDIMLQISNFKTINEMKEKSLKTDIYIKPDIKKFSVVSFGQGREIITEGEQTAFKQFEAMKKVAQKQQKIKDTTEFTPIQNVEITSFSLNGNKRFTRAYIKGKLQIKTPCNISLDKLNRGLDNLYSTGNFERIRYHIIKEKEKNILEVNVEESQIKSALRLGLHYDDLYKTAALVNYTKKNLLFQSDVLSFDAILGDKPRYNLDYYIDKGYYWSVGIHHRLYQYERDLSFDFEQKRRDLPDLNINFIDLELLDITSQIYIETLLEQKFGVRLGVEHKYIKTSTETFGLNKNEIPRTILDNVNYYSFGGKVTFDSYDNKYFPTKGAFFETEFNAYPFSSESKDTFEEFAIAKVNLAYAFPVGNKFSWQIEARGGFRLGNSVGINPLDFNLGGFGSKEINNQVAFYGYDFLTLTGDSFLKLASEVDYNFYKKHHVNIAANFANVGNEIFDLASFAKRKGFSGYAVGYGFDSIIGPIQIKYSFSDDSQSKDKLFFSVGYWF